MDIFLLYSSLQRLASVCLTLQEIIRIGTSVRDDALISTRLGKDDSVRSRAAACIRFIAVQDRELVIRPGTGERESFIVVVLMRVAAGGVAVPQVVAACADGFVDVGLVVAC